jgi:hypothetical protein
METAAPKHHVQGAAAPQQHQLSMLADFGKDGHAQEAASKSKHRADNIAMLEVQQKDSGKIPGYSGFIRGSQHMSGVSYGTMTHDVTRADWQDMTSRSIMPPQPQRASTGLPAAREPHHHLPGYTGFVPHLRGLFANTYGESTAG